MSTIRPARWVAGHAASGLRDLPRNGAWLLSKALRSPVAATESAAHDTSDGLRRMTIAVADKLPGGPDSVGIKLKRAETGGCPARRGTWVAARGDQAAASSLVGVTVAMVASRATRSAGRCR